MALLSTTGTHMKFISFSVVVLFWTSRVCFAQDGILVPSVQPKSMNRVQISFIPPSEGIYVIKYDYVECNDFRSSSAQNETVIVNGTNGSEIINVTTQMAGQYVSAQVANNNLTNYRFSVNCGSSFSKSPSRYSVDASVTVDGFMTIKIKDLVIEERVTVCQVEYRLKNGRNVNTVTLRAPALTAVNVTGLLKLGLYQIRLRCGVDGPIGVVYGAYTAWQDVLAPPLTGSLCNSNQPHAAASIMTVAILLVCAILTKFIAL